MDLSLLLDAIIAVLLMATIGYAVILNRRLTALRDAKAEMEAAAAQFAESTETAGKGLESLKDQAHTSGKTLQTLLDRARALSDDLTFLIERGSSLAGRLDAGDRRGPAQVAASSAAGPPRAKPHEVETRPGDSSAGDGAPDLSAQESELLKALQGMR